MPGDWD